MTVTDRAALERLHKLAETFPKLHGYFSSGTGGVDVIRLIEVLEDAAAEIEGLKTELSVIEINNSYPGYDK